MPLHPGTSRAVFSRNVSDMRNAGHPMAQSLAAAYREKRQSRADGGDVPLPTPDPRTQDFVLQQIQDYGAKVGRQPENFTGADIMNLQRRIGVTGGRPSRAPGGPVLPPAVGAGAFPGPQGGLGALAQRTSPQASPGLSMGMPPMPPGLSPSSPPGGMGGLGALSMGAKPLGMAAGGNPGSMPSMGSVPYFARAEARSLGHTGPVIGSTFGRGDSKSISVPGGSYVLPASHISALGEGNSLAGHNVIASMFGRGPYGTSLPKGGHGMGPPKPPRAGGFAQGGSPREGGKIGIMISDGEDVLSPEEVKMVDRWFGGKGDIDRGHRLLDAWVNHERQKQIKELKRLPGPAK